MAFSIPHRQNLPTPTSPAISFEFLALKPQDLPSTISDPYTLILDIRTLTAHYAGRIINAIPLSVPSTLLRRSLFSIEKLVEMVPTRDTRRRFSEWRSARRIVVYDADSSAISQGSSILGLLRKFHSEQSHDRQTKSDLPKRDLLWLEGGYQEVWRSHRDLIDTSPIVDHDADDEGQRSADNSPPAAVLRIRHLPKLPFYVLPTTSEYDDAVRPQQGEGHYQTHHAPSVKEDSGDRMHATVITSSSSYGNHQGLKLGQGITERIPLRISRAAKERVHELPLAWLRKVGRWADVDRVGEGVDEVSTDGTSMMNTGSGSDSDGSDGATSSDDELESGPYRHRRRPRFQQNNARFPDREDSAHADAESEENEDVAEGIEALAMQFYRIELSEQRRLIGIMEHHPHQSSDVMHESRSTVNVMGAGGEGEHTSPYSTSVGVESEIGDRDLKTWSSKRERTRLESRKQGRAPLTSAESSDDYVNASLVRPLGTTKRYIAMQEPLPETYIDFWTLVWEQNVHVIVMLAREIESTALKTASYRAGNEYGPFRLKLVSTEGAEDLQLAADGYFYDTSLKRSASVPSTDSGESDLEWNNTIKRVFELTHTAYPHLPPRRIVHMQYLGWHDMSVPDDTADLLQFLRQVEREVELSEQSRGFWEGPRRSDRWHGWSARGSLGPHSASDSDSEDGDGESASGSDHSTDPYSGIVRHAFSERPILVHCSAHVERTGGFIAIDAILDGVRREMRMRREAIGRARSRADSSGETSGDNADNEASGGGREQANASGRGGGARSIKGESGQSSENGEALSTGADSGTGMDVDGSGSRDEPSAGGLAAARESPGLVMNLPIAGHSVHVPIVNVDETMDVDAPSPWMTGDPSHAVQYWTPGTGVGRVPPPREALPPDHTAPGLAQRRNAHQLARKAKFELSGNGSDGSNSTSARSNSKSGGSGSGRNTSLTTGTSNSNGFFNTVKSVSTAATSSFPSSGSTPDIKDRGVPPASSRPSSSVFARMKAARVARGGSAQQDSGATEIKDSSFGPSTPAALGYTNLRVPRGDRRAPIMLSSLDEPIRRVVEDMREQRASLCQSLRQYIFVHQAVLEGALALVDEERAVYGAAWGSAEEDNVEASVVESEDKPRLQLQVAPTVSSAGKGKRGPSPTELPYEDAKGNPILAKRLSTKRRLASGYPSSSD